MLKLRSLGAASVIAVAFIISVGTSIQAQSSDADLQYQRMHEKPRALFDKWAAAKNSSEGKAVSPRERFMSLSVSHRSTFAAISNALLYTRLSDPSGKPVGFAIDLIDGLDVIAGEEIGKGGDQQFRLYVRLKPGTRRQLELAREFLHDKDNTVFHKGYPINYRQSGSPPTLQYSITPDETQADIDIDYRSSAFPAALFDGHLKAANSDVRASDNYRVHLRRWTNLVDWWDDLSSGRLLVPPTVSAPPANFATNTAGIDADDVTSLSDAAYQFFKSWLLDLKPDVALGYLRQSALPVCSNLKDDSERTSLDRRTRILFSSMLTAANKNLKKTGDLSAAILPVAPVDPSFKVMDHKWKPLFTVAGISDGDYDHHFLCTSKASGISDTAVKNVRQTTYGNHYVVKFQFRLADGNGGILRLLWTKEDNQWKIDAFDAVTG